MKTTHSMIAALCGVVVMALFRPQPGLAHHSVSAAYDTDHIVEFVGVITETVLRNPHGFVTLAVTDDSGAEAAWKIEMAAPNALVLRGIQPKQLLAVGQRVTIEAWPARDGSHSASGHLLTLPDGTSVDITDTFGRALGLNTWPGTAPAAN
jgi:Family of unknown function (DUF6152)